MDVTGVVLAVVVAVVASGLLYWHIQQVKKRPATSHDKLMGALWAALIVLALGRVAFLVSAGGTKPAEPATPAPATK
jgi:hypothetical protein